MPRIRSSENFARAEAEIYAAPQTDTTLAPIRNAAEEAPPAEPQSAPQPAG
jgi:hypothetical protein